MTILDEGYTDERFGPLQELDAHFHHLVLRVERVASTTGWRPAGSTPVTPGAARPCGPTGRRRAVDHHDAANTWLHRSGHGIDTTEYTPTRP